MPLQTWKVGVPVIRYVKIYIESTKDLLYPKGVWLKVPAKSLEERKKGSKEKASAFKQDKLSECLSLDKKLELLTEWKNPWKWEKAQKI